MKVLAYTSWPVTPEELLEDCINGGEIVAEFYENSDKKNRVYIVSLWGGYRLIFGTEDLSPHTTDFETFAEAVIACCRWKHNAILIYSKI